MGCFYSGSHQLYWSPQGPPSILILWCRWDTFSYQVRKCHSFMALAAGNEASCGLLKRTWVAALPEALLRPPCIWRGPHPQPVVCVMEMITGYNCYVYVCTACPLNVKVLRRQGWSLIHYLSPTSITVPRVSGHSINKYWMNLCHLPAFPEHDLSTLILPHKKQNTSGLDFFFFTLFEKVKK